MDINDQIKKAIKYGIYLGELSNEEEQDFLTGLNSFLILKKNFCFLESSTSVITVSWFLGEDLAEIFIHNGTLKITPLTSEGYFKIFMDTLEFISVKHKQEINEPENIIEAQTDDDESTEDDGELWL